MLTGDTRFVRQRADVQQLLDVLDLDGVEGLEDLLMLLFRRPVDLTYPQDGSPGCIEVIVHGDQGALGGKAANLTFAFVCGALECADGYSESTIQLSRSKK